MQQLAKVLYGHNVTQDFSHLLWAIASEMTLSGRANLADELLDLLRAEFSRVEATLLNSGLPDILDLMHQHGFEPIHPLFNYGYGSTMLVKAKDREYWSLSIHHQVNRGMNNKRSIVYYVNRSVGSHVRYYNNNGDLSFRLQDYHEKPSMSIVEYPKHLVTVYPVWHKFWLNPWQYLMMEVI